MKELYNIRIAGIEKESIVDGVGLRFTVFAQGCERKCEGCHNPHTHYLYGGYFDTVEHILIMFKENELLSGITFSGGEPFLQAKEFSVLAEEIHKIPNKDVWCYTGNVLELLLDWVEEAKQTGIEVLAERADNIMKLLNEVDYLVDGEYIQEQRSLELPFRGSKNQRIIDMRATRANGYKKVVLLDIPPIDNSGMTIELNREVSGKQLQKDLLERSRPHKVGELVVNPHLIENMCSADSGNKN